MTTLYDNVLGGQISDNPLSSGATTINSAAFANLSAVVAPDIMWITLDPAAAGGAPEIVKVTAHTASATSVTVVRAQQGTTARSHNLNTVWKHAATAADLDSFLVSVATANIADGAVTTAKVADANVTTAKVADGAVTTAKIAADAVTGAKIGDDQIDSEHYVTGSIDPEHLASNSVTTAKIADAAVTSAKLASTVVADIASAVATGVVGVGKASGTNQTGITTAVDVTGTSVTWTADSARTYKYTLSLTVLKDATAAFVGVNIANGAGTNIHGGTTYLISGATDLVTVVWTEAGLSGSQTRVGRVNSATGTVAVANDSDRNAILIVEDIGAT